MRPPARLTAPPPWLAAAFILAALPVLIWLALFVPPGELPDEVAHVIRADSVRHGEIAGFRRPRVDEQGDPATDVAVRADAGLLAAGFGFQPGIPLQDKHETAAWLAARGGLRWENRLQALSIPNTATYPPLLYVPAAAAMQAAKLAGYGPGVAILAARLLNVALYAAAGASAIVLARRGRAILLAILCLPMSLSLAASINHDGLILACAALAAALLTRRIPAAWWGGAVLFGVAAMAKPYLLPLALIIPAAVPLGAGRSGRRRGRALAGLAVAVLPGVAWGGAMALFVAAPFVRGPAQPAGPLWPGPAGTLFPTTNPGEQLRVLLDVPSRLLTLPLDFFAQNGDWLWHEVIGVLGTLDVILPNGLYVGWAWAFAAAVLAGCFAERSATVVRPIETAAAALGAIGAVWLVMILQYLSWSRVGAAAIEGVQGRYFLPIAILALPVAALPIVPIPAARVLLTAPALLLALAGLAVLPWVVLGAYFVR